MNAREAYLIKIAKVLKWSQGRVQTFGNKQELANHEGAKILKQRENLAVGREALNASKRDPATAKLLSELRAKANPQASVPRKVSVQAPKQTISDAVHRQAVNAGKKNIAKANIRMPVAPVATAASKTPIVDAAKSSPGMMNRVKSVGTHLGKNWPLYAGAAAVGLGGLAYAKKKREQSLMAQQQNAAA